MLMMMEGRSSNNSNPFTASQWHELEQQALIFKYITAGMPVPSDLILPLKMSLCIDPSLLPCIQYSPTIGWGSAYRLGHGKRIDDQEPGRCKRTDGKKWRCSKEACPDSKYCERHMHRGKSRSRKHVELSLATNTTTNTTIANATNFTALSLNTARQSQRYLFPCAPSSVPYNANYRNFLGAMEEVNAYPLLTQQSRDQLHCSDSHFRIGLSAKDDKEAEKLKSENIVKLEEAESAKPLHCFSDEWTQTQLSIAMPMTSYDMPCTTASQCYNDG